MKQAALSFLIILLGLSIYSNGLIAQKKHIDIHYDKFTRTTQIKTHISWLKLGGKNPKLFVSIICDGDNISVDSIQDINLIFVNFNSYRFEYDKCRSVYCLVDEDPLELPEKIEYEANIDNHGYWEYIGMKIDYLTLEKLWNAQKIEFKICNDEFSPGKDETAAIQEIKALFEK